MSTYVEVPFSKPGNGFDETFPVSIAHLMDGQTYVQAIQRINTAIRSVRYPRPCAFISVGALVGGVTLLAIGVVGKHEQLMVPGGVLLFLSIVILAIGGFMKSSRVKKALDSALVIENDRFLHATLPVSFRLFEQRTQEVVAHYDPPSHHHHHDNDRHHHHGHHHNHRGGWHYDTRTRIDWKLIVEVAGPPLVPVVVMQPQYGAPQYATPQYTTPQYAPQYAPQPYINTQPVYAQPNQTAYAQPTYVPPQQTRNDNVKTPLIAAPAFEDPVKPTTYLSPAGSHTSTSYGTASE